MASNSFGNIFRCTTFGESHGAAVGVVIDGCPAGVALELDEMDQLLARRAPGNNPWVSPRKEPDKAEILSGVFEGKTTGAPLTLLIRNQDHDSSKYESIKNLLRPGHANYTYLEKYGIFDYRGGGRSSARETAVRVAASYVAKKLLAQFNIEVLAYLQEAADESIDYGRFSLADLKQATQDSPIFCPDKKVEKKVMTKIEESIEQGDSLGAAVAFITTELPVGLGDPIYEKLEANLAKAMMSIPATKGFELGEGFSVIHLKGSQHNDCYSDKNYGKTQSNHSGGTLGGISTGMPLYGRVAFKPTSSINTAQQTTDTQGQAAVFKLPEGSRHDPCVAIRGVAVVEAMLALVLADSLLQKQTVKVEALQ